LRFDRSAALVMYSAEARLIAAQTAYDDCIAGRAIQDGRLARAVLDNATRAHEAAESALAHCRLTLSRAIDELHTIAVACDERLVLSRSSSAAVAVVAEATAIAAAEQAQVAAETQQAIADAARIVDAAGLAAADIVARAALEARTAREHADSLAARQIAQTAESAAVRIQLRADELASFAAADVAADLSMATREPRTARARAGEIAAARAGSTAVSMAHEATLAATLVAQAALAAAAQLRDVSTTQAAAAERDVLNAANAIKAIKAATAQALDDLAHASAAVRSLTSAAPGCNAYARRSARRVARAGESP
jgi:hypothetical protein